MAASVGPLRSLSAAFRQAFGSRRVDGDRAAEPTGSHVPARLAACFGLKMATLTSTSMQIADNDGHAAPDIRHESRLRLRRFGDALPCNRMLIAFLTKRSLPFLSGQQRHTAKFHHDFSCGLKVEMEVSSRNKSEQR